jgi:CRP/FNR family cyclic AMP-dependent transcriptional regulator
VPHAQDTEALQDRLLQEIAARGGIKNYPANAVLVNEGDTGDSLFIILSGRVKAYGSAANGREVIYSTQGPGEYFGELTLLDGGTRSASVMTLESTRCAVVGGAQVRDFLAGHPDFALHLLRRLTRLARAATDNVKSLALMDVYGRVARLLLELAQEEDGVLVVREKLTQQDIAERVGSSREMVSRIFKQLVEGEYLTLEGRRIVLRRKLPAGW